MSRIFEPWVGERYLGEGLGGLRVLILGESHYGAAGTENPLVTRKVVEEHRTGTSAERHFTYIQRLVDPASASNPSQSERFQFWEKVAFANFVQEFVAESPGIRPTAAMWKRGAEALPQTVRELQPDALLVIGKELAHYVPTAGVWASLSLLSRRLPCQRTLWVP